MSQYPPPTPSPYQPPSYQPVGYYYAPPQIDPRRAAILMFVLGGLMCLCGLCMGVVGVVFSQLMAAYPAELAQLQQQLQQANMNAKVLFIGIAVAALLPGIVMIVLGFFVRRGTMGPVVTALILCGMMLLGLGGVVVTGTVVSLMQGDPSAVAGLCVWAVPLALLVLLMVWLIQALRAVPQVQTMLASGAQNYQQYQQHQQMYGGYNYPPQPQQQPGQQTQPPQQPPQSPVQPPPTGGTNGPSA